MDVSENLTRRRLVLGYSEVFSFEDYWDEYKDILITTSGTYLLFVFFITFLFFKIFIDKPIIKISSAIDDLLISKHFDIHSFKEANRSVLSGLYAAVSKLVEEVVRFNREEEKLVLSRQIAHDLRAPLSVISDIFDTKESTSEIEKMALKRLQEITNGLMPETSDNKSNVINLRSLLNEITLMYPSVSFATTYSVHFKNDLFHL
jgi:signal transduction histidine kinase